MSIALFEAIAQTDENHPFVVATLVHVQGSAPQRPGARLVVFPDGSMLGTIGGGCLEMETRRQALLRMGEQQPYLMSLRLDDDFGWDDGLICGGHARVFLDPDYRRQRQFATRIVDRLRQRRGLRATTTLTGPCAGAIAPEDASPCETDPVFLEDADGITRIEETLAPPPRVVVCGCGHVGAAVVTIARGVGFQVVAVDDRPEYAHSGRFPEGVETRCEDLETFARTFASDDRTYWVIVTRGHRNDGRVLAGLLGRPKAYVGMIGSRRKGRMIREGLTAAGNDPQEIAAVHSPIGLDIGARTPEEIALAIVSELVMVRRKGTKQGPG